MNDFDRSDFMDKVVFWFCVVCWVFLMFMMGYGVI